MTVVGEFLHQMAFSEWPRAPGQNSQNLLPVPVPRVGNV